MDRARIEAFLDRFVDLTSGATTIGLLAVADRTGLSRHLAEAGGGTAEQIAAGAGLQTRYVVEILSGLAAAGVIEYDPASQQFELPPEHALFIADETSPYFMGGFLDMIPAMFAQIDGVAESTRHGGGVPFADYGPEMVRGIDRGNSPSQRVFLSSRWLPGVPGLVDRLERGIRVADVGCGTGTAAILIASAYPKSQVVGFDASPDAVTIAEERGAGVDNVTFRQMSVEEMDTGSRFGLITAFDVIHDLPDPLGGLRRIRQSLEPDGMFLMMEPNAGSLLEENLHSRGAMLYGISALHCMTQSLAEGGPGLGAVWGRQRAQALAEEAGFTSFQPLEEISNRFSSFYLLQV